MLGMYLGKVRILLCLFCAMLTLGCEAGSPGSTSSPSSLAVSIKGVKLGMEKKLVEDKLGVAEKSRLKVASGDTVYSDVYVSYQNGLIIEVTGEELEIGSVAKLHAVSTKNDVVGLLGKPSIEGVSTSGSQTSDSVRYSSLNLTVNFQKNATTYSLSSVNEVKTPVRAQ